MADALRQHLVRALAWGEAHIDFDTATADVPPEKRGLVPEGAPYSLWQLVEHLRITQKDILDFCLPGNYEERDWPAQYWPATAAPPTPQAWEESLDQFRRDRAAMQALITDPATDLFALVPHATQPKHTYLRAALLLMDHNAHHLGQIVLVRRLLGVW